MIAAVSGTVPAATTLPGRRPTAEPPIRWHELVHGARGVPLTKSRRLQPPCPGETGWREPDERQLRGPNGAVIEDVAGAAARAGVRQGDVIVAVNNVPIKSPEQLRELVSKAGKSVALLLQREDTRIFIPVTIG